MQLNQVTVPCRDVAKSISFYQKLGLKLIVKALPHYARFVCREGGSSFSLHQVEQPAQGAGVMVYFECEDLDERVARLQKAGIAFDEEPSDRRWLWREARLQDPDGNKLVLYWAGVNRLNPPWRLGETD